MKRLNISMLPVLTHPHETAGRTILVVDVLRASTTIISALAAGAKQIVPCLQISEAQDQARQLSLEQADILLGGERGGQKIAGFHLGNSPAEYTPEVVRDRTICFTTTNGTKAMMRCTGASRVVISAFTNLRATLRAIQADDEIEVLCAGTNDKVTREDVLFAGAIAVQASCDNQSIEFNDEARLAMDAWRSITKSGSISPTELASVFRETRGGQNLIALGRQEDLTWAAVIDRFDVVPELDLSTWRIRLP